MTRYFSGQGKIFVAKNTGGAIGAYRWLGNASDMSFELKSDTKEIQDYFSGKRLTDKILEVKNTATIKAKLLDFSLDNLAMVVRGTNVSGLAGTVTALAPDIAASGLVAGDVWALKNQNVSTVVVKDSAVTAATLVAGTDYILDAEFGTITILNTGTFVQPFKANYAFGTKQSVAFFSAPAIELAVRFEGINTADSNKKVLCEFYRMYVDPVKELALLSNNEGSLSFDGTVLVDPSKSSDDPVFGAFGRMTYLA